jgi:hypothetical protein
VNLGDIYVNTFAHHAAKEKRKIPRRFIYGALDDDISVSDKEVFVVIGHKKSLLFILTAKGIMKYCRSWFEADLADEWIKKIR